MGRLIASEEHRQLRVGVWRHFVESNAATVLSAPVIYSLILPFALLDVWVTFYQSVCFRAWGIDRVRRRRYLVIDHQKLAYLNGPEKLNCVYCGYVNGLVSYVGEIAARTEQYWCPIRHATPAPQVRGRAAGFADYGDARGYRERLPGLRAELKRHTTEVD